MAKIQMGPTTWLYPTPAFIIGANVDGKPNFMTAGLCGGANHDPSMVSVAIQPHRYTNKGVKQNGAFSVNVPSVDMIRETDYCGIVSGSEIDKAKVCQFRVFYGKSENAPMIEQCPINLECRVLHTLTLGSNELVIGRVEETHINEDCLTDEKPDIAKVKPFIFTPGPAQYYAFGEMIGKAFVVGNELLD